MGEKTTIKEAPESNYDTPNEGAKVVFSSVKVYKGKRDFSRPRRGDNTKDEKELVFASKEGEDVTTKLVATPTIRASNRSSYPRGEGIQRMKVDETAQIVLPQILLSDLRLRGTRRRN